MLPAQKTKLDGIDAGAEKNWAEPTDDGNLYARTRAAGASDGLGSRSKPIRLRLSRVAAALKSLVLPTALSLLTTARALKMTAAIS